MNKSGLFSMQGSVVLGVDASQSWDIIDLIRAKKTASGAISDPSYDLDGDGAVTANDVDLVKDLLIRG